MLSGWRTIWYFLWRGFGYGLMLGALAGSLVYPVFGTIGGGIWGAGVGIVLGLILGTAGHFYNRRAYRQQMAFEAYQANFTMGAGLAAAILGGLPLFLIFAPIAGLTAAYVANRYAEDNAKHIAKRKVEGMIPEKTHMERPGVISKFVDQMLSKAKWPIGLAAIGLSVLYLLSPAFAGQDALAGFIAAGITGIGAALAGTLAVTTLGLANGVMIQFLNRLVFKQDMEKQRYKRAIVAFSAVFTLLISPVVTLGLGAPLAALVAAWAAAAYVDWYYADMPKRKHTRHSVPQHHLLEDEIYADDALYADDDYADERQRERLR